MNPQSAGIVPTMWIDEDQMLGPFDRLLREEQVIFKSVIFR
jgi:hypothetical protein